MSVKYNDNSFVLQDYEDCWTWLEVIFQTVERIPSMKLLLTNGFDGKSLREDTLK